MMNKRIGYSSIIKIDAKTMQLLNLKENYCLVCVPGDLIERHNVKAFDIILDENKIILVAQPVSQATNENRPTRLKEISS